MHALSVFAVVRRTAAARLLDRAVPLFAGVALAATVAFGPNGADPRDVVRLVAVSPGARVSLWAAWLLLATPLAGALIRDRRADFLRALPAARPWLPVALGLWLLAAQAPWALLFTAGAGPAAGGRAALLAAALSTSLAAAPALAALDALALAAAGAAIVLDASPLASAALAPVFAAQVHRAWLRAPERPAISGAWIQGPAPVAVALAHALRLARVERVAALRALAAAALGGAFAGLVVRNGDHLGEPGEAALFLALVALPLVVAAGSLAPPLRESARALEPFFASTQAPDRVRRAGLALASTTAGLGLGAVALVTARLVAPVSLHLVALAPSFGAALVGLGVAAEHRARADVRQRDEGGRVVAALLLLGGGAIALAATLGAWVVAALGAAHALGFAWTARRSRVHRPSSALLELRGVWKRFGAKIVLRELCLRVDPGELVLLRGRNGAGKSTALRVAAGLLEPEHGEVLVRAAGGRALGYAPDVAELPDHLSVAELLALVSSLSGGAPSFPEDRARLDVDRLADDRLSALSLGQRRRASLASALVGRPPLLLLDEPTNGLDVAGLAVLRELLEEQRARGAALVASHDEDLAAAERFRVVDLAHGCV